jgi:hypothetical protein
MAKSKHELTGHNLLGYTVPENCLKVLDSYQPLNGPCRWNNQVFYSLLFDG